MATTKLMKKHKIPKSIKLALEEGKQRRRHYKIFDILRDDYPSLTTGYKGQLRHSGGMYYAPYIPMQMYGRALRTSLGIVNVINIA